MCVCVVKPRGDDDSVGSDRHSRSPSSLLLAASIASSIHAGVVEIHLCDDPWVWQETGRMDHWHLVVLLLAMAMPIDTSFGERRFLPWHSPPCLHQGWLLDQTWH